MCRYFPIITAILVSLSAETRADTIVQWNFNSPTPDGNTTTGTITPSTGTGTASLVGLTATAYLTGDKINDPAGSNDNSGWSPTGWPAINGANKSYGVQFLVDTTGYTNIMVSWSEEHSSTGSRYMRLQYTTDGLTWTDNATANTVSPESTYLSFSTDLSAVAATANNNKFGIRIVSEWEITATGGGTSGFLASKTTSTYAAGGTVRFDMMTISGTATGTSTSPVALSVGLSGGNVQISWPTNNTGSSVLQSNSDLGTTNWGPVDPLLTVTGTSNVVTITNATGANYYRLKM